MKNPVVLVVDDEPLIRIETVQMVKDAGCAALEASNTNDAITILEERRDILVVFTEVRVPGHLNGMELGHVIAKRWPLIDVIVTSGFLKVDNFPADWRYIPKPYDGAQLAAALRALLAPRLSVVH